MCIRDSIHGAVVMAQSHCESSGGSADKCRLSARWLPTLRPSQTIWAASTPVGCYHPHTPSPLLLLLSPIADTHFTIQRRLEGWVELGTAVKVRSPCPRLYIAAAVAINTAVCGKIRTWVLTPQSDALTTQLLRPAMSLYRHRRNETQCR